jgi:hypothetical protein
MGMLDALFDTEKVVTEKIIESGKNFAKEIGCPVEEVNIRIRFNKEGQPFYQLFRADKVKNINMKIRNISVSEII